jgi:hypothetical protein
VAVTANRVRVENLRIMNSRGRGVGVSDASDVEVLGCSLSNIYKRGIHFLRSPRARAENNFVTAAGLANKEDGSPWGAAIEIVQSNAAIVRNNVVSETWGEGINAHSGSQYTLIEHNYLFGVRAVGIYSDAAPDTTIRRNIIVGTANSAWWRSAGTVGAGIALNNEAYHFPVGGGSQSVSVQSKRAKIYDNLVAFTNTGIALWGSQLPETSFDEVLIYNNTLVDNTYQAAFGGKPKPGAKFMNNILLSLSSGTHDVDGSNLNGMTAKNNYFSQGDPGGGFSHPGNRYTGLKLAKMSGWRAVSSRTQITWRDFVVASGSPVIGAGDDEPWRTATTEHDYRLDYNKAEHRLPMDMGALTFATPGGPRPMPPLNLSGT